MELKIQPRIAKTLAAFLLLIGAAAGMNRFSSYGPVNAVNDVAALEGMIYAATNGGLYAFDANAAAGQLQCEGQDFPDLRLTALCADGHGGLWVGSKLGYLTHWPSSGVSTVYTSYKASGWEITALTADTNYVYVGSTDGVSVFDIGKGRAVGSATKFGDFSSSEARAIAVLNSVLYVGCDQGVASVPITPAKLASFNDRNIWSTRSTANPVVDFVEHNGSVQGLGAITTSLGGATVYADSNRVTLSTGSSIALPGKVTSLAGEGDQCWIGTSDRFFYSWGGRGEPVQRVIDGMTFSLARKIWAAPRGSVWIMPRFGSPDNFTTPWNMGLLRFDAPVTWRLYNEHTAPSMGWLCDAGGTESKGLFVDRSGNVWVSFSGGNLKRYDPASDTWTIYWVSGMDAGNGPFTVVPAQPPPGWGRVDGMAEDSSGFLWFGSYNNYLGCLIAYDPKYPEPTGHYRRHIVGQTSPYYMKVPATLCVASNGWILAGSEDGKLLVASHSGDPISSDVEIKDYYSSLTNVKDMTATSDGVVWVATGNLWEYTTTAPANQRLQKYAPITEAITCIEQETDKVLWLGTASQGIIRLNLTDSSKSFISVEQGLISSSVTDLSIDRVGGNLWIATEEGISRYSLGHGEVVIGNNAQARAYPNPFSFSKPQHHDVIFDRIAPQSKLLVYDAKGTLVQEATPLIKSDYEWTYKWTPRRGLIPGTYFYAARPPSGKSASGKLLLLP